MLSIRFLPARYGDCIWIEYLNENKISRILIDGGTGGTREDIVNLIDNLPEEERVLELCVVTHIDRDHIEGILSLLTKDLSVKINDLWFNGYKHLPSSSELEQYGALQGERLTEAILEKGLPWNSLPPFKGGAVMLDGDNLLEINLPGEMKLTLLSPSIEQLKRLKPKWKSEVEKAGLIPGVEAIKVEPGKESFGTLNIPDIEALIKEPFDEDTAEANGSSIAFIAEFKNKRILLTGDAHPTRILDSLTTLYPTGKVKFDLIKLSHHGSSGNTSPKLLEKVDCGKFVFSTNGSIFEHPAQNTVARVIKSNSNPKDLIFNYKTPYTSIWDSQLLKGTYKYRTIYPSPVDSEGIEVKLL